MEESAGRWRSVSRRNVLTAITAAIIGLIYGYDLGYLGGSVTFGIFLALVSFAFV